MEKLQCPICKEYFENLSNHLRNTHKLNKEEFRKLYPTYKISIKDDLTIYKCYYCDYRGTEEEIKEHILNEHFKGGLIECPICHEKYKTLNTHLFYEHNIIIEDFKKEFPGYPIQLPVKHEKKKCPYCDFWSSPSGLGTHISYKHNNVKRNDPENKSKKDKKEGFLCPICKKYFINFSQHIEMTHNIKWEDFVKEYNWTSLKTWVSDDHKENLSKNKKKFYNDTERGIELRQEQSLLMSGKGNVVHLPGVRNKISKGAANRVINADTSLYFKSGIRVTYRGQTYRSLEEFKIALILLDNKIEFEYENEWILYLKKDRSQHRYVIDFKIDGVIYEIKADAHKNQYEEEEKYNHCKELFGNKFKIVNAKMLFNILNVKDRKLLIDSFFQKRCREILENEEIIFWKQSKAKNYSFFKKLDPNFENNKKFICI